MAGQWHEEKANGARKRPTARGRGQRHEEEANGTRKRREKDEKKTRKRATAVIENIPQVKWARWQAKQARLAFFLRGRLGSFAEEDTLLGPVIAATGSGSGFGMPMSSESDLTMVAWAVEDEVKQR
jgi:hypothetical protein